MRLWIIKHLKILFYRRIHQVLFWLTEMPPQNASDFVVKNYLEELLKNFGLLVFKKFSINYWKSFFTPPPNSSFNSVSVVILISFSTTIKNKKSFTTMHYSKITLSETNLNPIKSWKKLTKVMLNSVDEQIGFKNIESLQTFKIALVFDTNFLPDAASGELSETKLDSKTFKLLFIDDSEL